MSALLVEAVGPLALVEDLGRPGHAGIGVTTSGAADRRALRLANRLLGNEIGTPAIEVLLGGLALRAEEAVTVCVTGAPVPLDLSGRPVGLGLPVTLRKGDVLTLGTPAAGLRTYVGVRGGIDARRLFGSVSTDPTQGIGPDPLAPGQRLAVGRATEPAPDPVDVVAPVGAQVTDIGVRVVLGPRDDWFTSDAVRTLVTVAWTVTPEGDRVGVRLSGPVLARSRNEELPSEPLVRGAVQVPPSGQPLVFLADHPTTGGYPVIAVVMDDDTDALAQLRPGEKVRFRRVPRGW